MARSGVRWFRAVLLTLFLVSAGGIVYLLGFSGDGGAGQIPSSNDIAASEPVADAGSTDDEAAAGLDEDDTVAVRSTGHRQTVTQGGRVLLELVAAVATVDKDGSLAMIDVEIGLPRPEGRYDVKSNSGTFRKERQEAVLRGDVVVVGPQPFKLWTDWLDLINQGNVLIAADGSRFELGKTARGTATKLRVDLLHQAMLMNKGVSIASLPGSETPFSLDAEVIKFQDDSRLIRADGGVQLVQGANSLEARTVSVFLDEFTDRVTSIRGIWQVKGSFKAAGSLDGGVFGSGTPGSGTLGSGTLDSGALGSTVGEPATPLRGANPDGAVIDAEAVEPATVVDYEATSLRIRLDERGQARDAELRGTPRMPVLMWTRPTEGLSRTIRAGRLIADFKDGAIETVTGVSGILIEERSSSSADALETDLPLRSASARVGTTTFDDAGQVVMVNLEREVEIKDARFSATAARVKMLVLQEIVELFGEPLVQLTSAEGVLRAPLAKFNQRLGLLETSGGTRARLDDSQTGAAVVALGGGGATDDPVYVEAEESLFRQDDGGFLFRGGVRAWQGKNLLICDQLRGERNGADLSAIGSVRTVWFPEAKVQRTDGGAGQGVNDPTSNDPTSNNPRANDGPVEVRAGYMEYLRDGGQLKYEQDVRVQQAAGLMKCATLLLELDDAEEVESMLCVGGKERASLTDEEIGRRILGERMTYYPKLEQLEVEGRVEAVEGQRRFSGDRVMYDLENGSFSGGKVAREP